MCHRGQFTRNVSRRPAIQIREHDYGELVVRIVGHLSVESLDTATVLILEMPFRRGDHQAAAVVLLVGRGHFLQRRRGKDLAAIKSVLPHEQVVGSGIEGSGGERYGHVDVARVDRASRARPVAGGTMRNDCRVRVVPRVLHPQRLENVLRDEIRVGLSADLFQQVSEKYIT